MDLFRIIYHWIDGVWYEEYVPEFQGFDFFFWLRR